MKVNIIVFELCKIIQLREQLCEYFQHIQGPQDVAICNSKETLKGKNTKYTKQTKTTSVASTSSIENKEKKNMDKNKPNPKVDGDLIGRK